MVHLRINEREPNPNHYVNFITVLPMGDPTTEDAARQLLRALAAQVKPIMKAHGFVVNSLEEYEYNRVFAGRNWNHGETIELVLRSSTGSLLSTHWLMSTLCHELAHIEHMHHGLAFQTLWRQLQQEVRALQSGGYYGDGYWSSGHRLVASAKIARQGIEMGGPPEYMCGGAHSRKRPISLRPRNHMGPQTCRKRKAGRRVNSNVFDSSGKSLNEDLEGEHKSHGIGFRKKAGSKRAREERALAAERRIQELQGEASSSDIPVLPTVEDASESGDGDRDFETDYDRRRTLLEAIEEKDLDALRATMIDPTRDFLLPSVSSGGHEDICGVGDSPRGGSAAADNTFSAMSIHASTGSGCIRTPLSNETPARPRKKRKTWRSNIGFTSPIAPVVREDTKTQRKNAWDCLVCTLTNEPDHLSCSACGTPRGESKWVGEKRGPS